MVESKIASKLVGNISQNGGVVASLLFGSQMRGMASTHSDLDIQVVGRKDIWGNPIKNLWGVTTAPLSSSSIRFLGGGACKLSLRSSLGSADIVILRWLRMEIACCCGVARLHKLSSGMANVLRPLVHIIAPGYRVIKGDVRWKRFYDMIVVDIGVARLSDIVVREMMRSGVSDIFWAREKCRSGENFAALRTLFRNAHEINLMLANELRLRRGRSSIYDGRRMEELLSVDDSLLLSWFPDMSYHRIFELCERCSATMLYLGKELLQEGASAHLDPSRFFGSR